MGTGFIYAYREDGGGYGGWLVTCKHVVEGIGRHSDSVYVRANRASNSGIRPFRANLKWTFHPSADVAVHVTQHSVLEEHNVEYMALAHGYTRADAMAESLLEGDSVFLIGFPSGWKEGRHDYPVVRYGVLAQIRGWYNQEHETFLVDGSGFGGNSGGPVITKPEISAVSGGDGIRITASRLIGMVSKVTREPAEMVASGTVGQAGDTNQGFFQHSDLIEVVPVDLIEETIGLARAERAASAPVGH